MHPTTTPDRARSRASMPFLTVALAVCVGTAFGGATLILDDFDAIPNDDFGGPRALSTVIIGNPFGQISNFDVDPALAFGSDVGALVFNAGIGVEQEASARWDNDGAGLSLDVSAAGILGFELDFAGIDQDFDYSFRLIDGAGEVAAAGGTFLAGGVRTEVIALGDFALGAFDATDLDAILIVFNTDGSTASLDFILTEFRAIVPTPGTLTLIAAGTALTLRRKR